MLLLTEDYKSIDLAWQIISAIHELNASRDRNDSLDENVDVNIEDMGLSN